MPTVVPINHASFARASGACLNCCLLAWCFRADVTLAQAAQINALTEHQRRVRSKGFLFRAGDSLRLLYVIRSGSLKTSITDRDGREQVTGFSLPGEFIGTEAIETGVHPCNVVALEPSTVCGVPYADIERLCRDIPSLQQHLLRMMSGEIARRSGLMMLLGTMRAEERLAAFLINLSRRYAARGFSATQFALRMSREEIGSFLGLKFETVSRLFSRFHDYGILGVDGRNIEILNPERLQCIIGDQNLPLRPVPGTKADSGVRRARPL
jgi:CRP/FNR family transcriptional regulator